MHSGHSCGAKSTVARDTGLITPGKKNIYNLERNHLSLFFGSITILFDDLEVN